MTIPCSNLKCLSLANNLHWNNIQGKRCWLQVVLSVCILMSNIWLFRFHLVICLIINFPRMLAGLMIPNKRDLLSKLREISKMVNKFMMRTDIRVTTHFSCIMVWFYLMKLESTSLMRYLFISSWIMMILITNSKFKQLYKILVVMKKFTDYRKI